MKVLVVLTNIETYGNTDDTTGLWLSEATEFVTVMEQAGISVDYVSPKGGYVPLDPRSLKYVNEEIRQVYQADDFRNRALSNSMKPEDVIPEDYDAVYYTGGHGVMWDFPGNAELNEISNLIFQQGGFVTSVCHGIAGLFELQTPSGERLITGKAITGFTTTEEYLSGKALKVPFMNEKIAQKYDANFQKRRAYKPFVVQDGRLITGQNPFSATLVAKKLLVALKK